MLRVYKHYHAFFHDPAIRSFSYSQSDMAGYIYSGDDFILTDQVLLPSSFFPSLISPAN